MAEPSSPTDKMDDARPLVSVHDLMPETLSPVLDILARLGEAGLAPATLLVVPGCDWSRDQLRTLKSLERAGHELAGHGWRHRAERIAGPGHWLHSRLISRQVAEHLCLTEDQIAALIGRCFGWFGDVGLQAPALYVPPAWAMGPIARTRLATLPFRYYEALTGIYDAARDRFRRLPLLGYEADDRLRAWSLRLSNGLNRAWANSDRPLRLAIHPRDLALRLDADLLRDLRRYGLPARHGIKAKLA